MAQYKAEGYDKRKKIYKGVITLGALIVAILVTMGLLDMADVTSFIEEWDTAIGILGGAGLMIAGNLAHRNVDPPADPQPEHPEYRKPMDTR